MRYITNTLTMRIDGKDPTNLELTDDVLIEYDDLELLRQFAKQLPGNKLRTPAFFTTLKTELTTQDREKVFLVDGDPKVYRYRDYPRGFIISPSFEDISQVVMDLELPVESNSLYFVRLWGAGEFLGAVGRSFRDYQGKYTVETLGVKVRSVPMSYLLLDLAPRNPLSLPRFWLTPSSELIQIWRVRILDYPLCGVITDLSMPLTPELPSCLYVEERWHPWTWHTILMGGLEHFGPSSSLEVESFFRNAKQILAGHRRKAGRPEGTREYQPNEFIARAKEVYRELLAKTGLRPPQKLVALRMGISISAFKRYWRASGLRWPPPDWSSVSSR